MPTVLILEDDSTNMRVFEAMLARAGWTVLRAESAHQALDRSEQHDGPIELLIADVVLKESSGGRLARILLERRPELVCLFVSGYPLDHLYTLSLLDEEMLASRRVQFLEKPFTLRTLLDAVGHMTAISGAASR